MVTDDYEQTTLMSNMQYRQSTERVTSPDRDSDIESGLSGFTQPHDDGDNWMSKDGTKGRVRSRDLRFTFTISQTSFRTHLAYGAAIFLLFLVAVTLLRMTFFRRPPLSRSITTTKMVKPHNYRIQASVFYGRRAYVDILDCYLQRNLVKNGGWLDEVNFLIHTNDKEDVKWVKELISKHPEFTASYVANYNYAYIWKEKMSRSDTIYIKIDDDVLWFDDTAIPHIVTTLLSNPTSLAVSANAINSPEGNWLHYHTDAIHPFLPTPFNTTVNHNTSNTTTIEWRPSTMLLYPFHLASRYPGWNQSGSAPAETDAIGLEWSRLERTSQNLHKTPIALGTYDPFGPAWRSWALAAQQHYSLLANLEEHTLDRYHIGDRPWNMQYGRYSINFVAIKGSTVQILEIHGDDEKDLTEVMPKKLGKPFLLETKALISHFSFNVQSKGLRMTDLLRRYRGYANEMVCGAENQKAAWVGFE